MSQRTPTTCTKAVFLPVTLRFGEDQQKEASQKEELDENSDLLNICAVSPSKVRIRVDTIVRAIVIGYE